MDRLFKNGTIIRRFNNYDFKINDFDYVCYVSQDGFRDEAPDGVIIYRDDKEDILNKFNHIESDGWFIDFRLWYKYHKHKNYDIVNLCFGGTKSYISVYVPAIKDAHFYCINEILKPQNIFYDYCPVPNGKLFIEIDCNENTMNSIFEEALKRCKAPTSSWEKPIDDEFIFINIFIDIIEKEGYNWYFHFEVVDDEFKYKTLNIYNQVDDWKK